jgi:hypothetical protein
LNESLDKTPQTKKTAPWAVFVSPAKSWLVANHDAAAINAADPMLSSAAARSSSFYDHGARNDNNFPAVRAASAFGSTMKAGTAATFHLDDHAVRTLAGCQWRGLRGASRYS